MNGAQILAFGARYVCPWMGIDGGGLCNGQRISLGICFRDCDVLRGCLCAALMFPSFGRAVCGDPTGQAALDIPPSEGAKFALW